MASDKYLAVIGLGDEDTAHLRLLLRKVAGQLEQNWRWGTEENADLVIVDPSQLAGQIARNRAYSGGRRCAVFHESEALRDGELRLILKSESLVGALNGIGVPSFDLGEPVMRADNDFYASDSFDSDFHLEEDEAANARAQRREESPAVGLDELLKPDAEASKPQFAVPMNLDAATRIQRGGRAPSARGERRVADSVRGIRAPEGRPEGINFAAGMDPEPAPGGKHPLRDYLHRNLLGGPARTSLDGAPELILDPKHRHFCAAGALSGLLPYCSVALARSDWQPVTSQVLEQARARQPARPYEQLVWLDAYANANGQLARRLDPGGQFRFKGAAIASVNLPHHARIVAAMTTPARLNEIAATSGAPMAEVFSIVSAYDAIDRIEVRGRLPRHAPAAPAGLLARLRNPFARR